MTAKKATGSTKKQPQKNNIIDEVESAKFADYVNVAVNNESGMTYITFGYTDPHSTKLSAMTPTVRAHTKVVVPSEIATNLRDILPKAVKDKN